MMFETNYPNERGAKQIQHANHIRYSLAKRKMDDLFLKWITLPNTDELLKKVLSDLSQRKELSIISPTPFFSAPRLSQPVSNLQKSPQTPPRSPQDYDKGYRRIHENEKSPPLHQQIIPAAKPQKSAVQPTSTPSPIQQFYFPGLSKAKADISEVQLKLISEIFGPSDTLSCKDFEQVTTKVCGIPKYLSKLLFAKIETKTTITKATFLQFFRGEFAGKKPKERAFFSLKKKNAAFIDSDDLKPLLKILLETHPGLEFLGGTPEFQERYAETVIIRIFYSADTNDDGKISAREFACSQFFEALCHLEREDDINKVRAFFSYEHFYVIYCKFWELDTDHDFLLSKEDFSRYAGYTLSKRVVDRIFGQIGRKFRSKVEGKMNYEDFAWFLLSEEDKMTNRSIDYWFRVLDLDDNGIVTGFELEYFYQEQRQRLEYLNHELVLFEDVLCQMADMFKPEKELLFRTADLRAERTLAPTFFNVFTNLNKFVAYEQRDPFVLKNEGTEFPDYSDWDKFAQSEYARLALEEEHQENQFELE
eukprot:TRINITY_DN464_c0_g1_i6.p1 TRINITY_DN464_c0_g1~~TRINITY_DN464_c0_g1_i6.p1  ORF type:complete len:534 (+),score=103.75 TRINITY_DN464_c0_g1_i6:138-1739(+)